MHVRVISSPITETISCVSGSVVQRSENEVTMDKTSCIDYQVVPYKRSCSPFLDSKSPSKNKFSGYSEGDAHIKPGNKSRKSFQPRRSASRFDPTFRGVSLVFHTKLTGCSSQLVITAFFSKVKPARHSRHLSVSPSQAGSSSETEDEVPQYKCTFVAPSGKLCASCSTRSTPLWRDAEDGTPLCNACGIRYKKYRVHCCKCWHIPKKDDKAYPCCSRCNSVLRVTLKS